MMKIKVISKVLMIFIFIQLSLTLVFAVNCVSNTQNVPIIQGFNPDPQNPQEYLIKLNTNVITNNDLNFVKINSDNSACQNKIFVLDINNSIDFNISGSKRTQYIKGVDILRLKKDVNFTVDNTDGLGITTIYLDVNNVEIDGNVTLIVTDDNKRTYGNNTLKLKTNELLVKDSSKLQLKIIGDSLGTIAVPDYIESLNLDGTNIWLNVNNIRNNGDLVISLIGGNGGKQSTQLYHGIYHSYGGNGGAIYDLNIYKFINYGTFDYNSIGGKKGGTKMPLWGYFNKAGDVGSINIDYLYNGNPNFSISTEIQENNVDDLSSVSCGCSSDCANTTDPKIGDINIKYLASGSYLPKKLEIIKNAVYSSYTTINIKGCHAASSGNSNISYKADNLILQLANLGIIQNDFDNNDSVIGNITASETSCPVCDSLELNNFALRTNTEYTIYTDQDGNIYDLNIYYVNPDGTLFRPPGYPSNKDYVVYNLKSGEAITPTQNQFIGTNIKEYKISKEILHYNPENFDLTNIPEEKGYDTEDVRLFCQAQRYLLRFRPITPNPFDDNPIKEIYFTPLFDIK